MHVTINIDGGLGRVICAVPAIENFAKNNNDFSVITPWSDVFANHPTLKNVYHSDTKDLWENIISKGAYLHPEPYQRREYYTQKAHLIDAFNLEINNAHVQGMPHIYLSAQEKTWAENFARSVKNATRKRKLIAFQPYGATFKSGSNDETDRSFSQANTIYIANRFMTLHADAALVNCTTMPFVHPNVFQQTFTTRQLFAVVSVCDAIFSIDSVVSHIGAAFDKKGVLILGGTHKENVGYENFKTFTREGYPKAYLPIRLGCQMISKNQGAMDFSQQQLDDMIRSVF